MLSYFLWHILKLVQSQKSQPSGILTVGCDAERQGKASMTQVSIAWASITQVSITWASVTWASITLHHMGLRHMGLYHMLCTLPCKLFLASFSHDHCFCFLGCVAGLHLQLLNNREADNGFMSLKILEVSSPISAEFRVFTHSVCVL